MSRFVVALLLLGCNAQHAMGPSFDLEALSAASSADQVRAAMPDDAELQSAWTCGEVPSPLTPTAAGELWDRCGLSELASKSRFLAAPGDRVAAAQLHLWLKSKSASSTVNGPRLLLGEAPFEGDLDLPVLASAPAVPVEAGATVHDRITGPGGWGRFPYWEIPGTPNAKALAVDASLPVSTLRFALASRAADGHPVPLLVLSDTGVTSVPLALPTDAPATEVAFEPGQPLQAPAEGAVRVKVSDDVPVGTLVGALSTVLGRRIELAMDHAPCLEPPAPGMRCVVGDGTIGTFYVDEVADADDAACVKAEVCRSPKGTWEAARELCSFRGKRLPTVFEARRAEITGAPTWTGTWAGDGAAPLGTCDGAPKCKTSKDKLLTDGTAKAPTLTVKGPPLCVAGDPWLTSWPPAVVSHPPSARPDPQPPTAEELAIAWGVKSDELEDKGICGEEVRANWRESLQKGGRSTMECRDPYSYVTTNEPYRYLFQRFLHDAGGIYVGVGSDQSLDFIVEQRPDWAFVFDYDPNVVRFHQVVQALLRGAETREAFLELWQPENKEQAAKLVGEAWPDDANVLESFFFGYRGRIASNLKKATKPSPEAPDFGFLATPENYAYLRLMAQQKRIVPVGVDMLETVGMRSIGDAANKLGEPVRIYYTSNAPTAWGGQATPDYKANVLSLPMDDRSMVLATFNSGAWHQVGHWRYDVMSGLLQQQRLSSEFYTDNKSPTWDRIPGDDGSLTVVGLPSRFLP